MKSDKNKMSVGEKRVAIVHDWLVGGGAELVVEQLHKIYPNAPIYTSYCSDEWRKRLDYKVVTGYLQSWPFPALRKYLPILRTRWFSRLDLTPYDLIISSSGNGEAKQINKRPDTTHINYCRTPPHYLWSKYDQYVKTPGFGLFNPLARAGLKTFLKPLRKKDLRSAKNVDSFIANSSHIQSDIKKYYGRDSIVIHPPVNVTRFNQSANDFKGSARHGFITVGRQVPYKRVDIIIQACNQLEAELTVIGRGPEHKRLIKMAGPTIKFDANATDEKVTEYMASAKAFIFTAEEDFGITPVEAMASGTPVIAYKAGGAMDYVIPGVTGEFFDKQSVDSLADTLQSFPYHGFKPSVISAHAEKFSTEKFQKSMQEFIGSKI